MLEDYHALIFGASSALSRSVSHRLSLMGATVHLSGHRIPDVMTLSEEIQSSGGKASAACVDARVESEITSYISTLSSRHPIDIVFNGIDPCLEVCGSVSRCRVLSMEESLLYHETLVGSQFLTSRVAAPYLSESKNGSIILLSITLGSGYISMSSGARVGCGGIEALTRLLAAELGPSGVRVNCVKPTFRAKRQSHCEPKSHSQTGLGLLADGCSPFASDGVLNRAICQEDIAGMVSYLSSPMARDISGQLFSVPV